MMLRSLLSALLLVALTGCDGSVGNSDCPGCDYPDGNKEDQPQQSTPSNPSAPQLTDCQSDAACTAPYVCNLTVHKCVPPSAKNNGPCDPIEGQSCPSGQQCIDGVCMTPPSSCQTNDDCPAGYMCKSGACVPEGINGQPGCSKNTDCPTDQVCVGGVCTAKAACNVPHATDRLAGTWKLDSMLHVRDGLQGFTEGLLDLASTLQSIIDGKFSISGVPSFFTSIIGGLLQGVIKQYVPPWGTQVISLLNDINEVIKDTHVLSTEQITSIGNDMYLGNSIWNLVEFEYKGVKVSTTPNNIPGLGQVTTEDYAAREVCGVFFMDKHKVKDAIGKIFRWAVEAVITGVSCTMENGPCYKDLPTMFNDLIDCSGLAASMASSNGQVSGLEALVLATCVSQKQNFINLLVKALEDLEVNLTYMSLSAKADVASANQLVNGHWYGALGSAYSKGNFEGTFTGVKQ
jgi:hypothetical protein